VEHLNRNKETLHPTPILIEGNREGVQVEIALQWNDGYAENVSSFANNINTHDGGTHLVGFKSALTRALNSYATSSGLARDLPEAVQGEDAREGLAAVISVKVPTRSSRARPRASWATPRSRASWTALSTRSCRPTWRRTPDRPAHRAQGAGGGPRPRAAARRAT